MAKYENEGYCPNNCFTQYDKEGSETAERSLTILGSRTAYMVYDEGVCAYDTIPYVVDAILGAAGTLGIEFATAIRVLIPVCNYPNDEFKLSCFDILNPTAIPNVFFNQNEDHWEVSDNQENTFLFEDSRFLAVIVKVDEQKLQLYFWKK